MGATRIAIYLVGLLLVVGAAWVFLTQTDAGRSVPAGVGVALILLLVGIGVMASAKSINDSRVSRRVVHDSSTGPRTYDTRYAGPATGPVVGPSTGPYVENETYVEERRYD
jgi:thiol:disulfide interchange protein